MSSRVYEWARGLRGDSGASIHERLHQRGQRAMHRVARWSSAARKIAAPERADRDVAEATGRVADVTRREEARLVQMFLTPGPDAPRAVLFTGVEHDNGCAHVCLRTAHALARLTRQSVCVVDADLRAPKLHRLVSVDGHAGLADAMAGSGDASSFAQRLSPDNLWLLAAGSTSDLDSPLTIDRMGPCLKELGTRFEHVVISASPIDLWAESLAVSRFVDGVILVLKAHVTRREIVRNVKAHLEDLNAPLLGVVLNDRTFPIPEPLYRRI